MQRHMLAGPPIFTIAHIMFFDSLFLTDCNETRQSHKRASRQGSLQPVLVHNPERPQLIILSNRITTAAITRPKPKRPVALRNPLNSATSGCS
jgi:hypothetical protein